MERRTPPAHPYPCEAFGEIKPSRHGVADMPDMPDVPDVFDESKIRNGNDMSLTQTIRHFDALGVMMVSVKMVASTLRAEGLAFWLLITMLSKVSLVTVFTGS